MLLESDILRLFFTGPCLVSSPLCSVSGVDCPSVLPRQLLLFASLLSSLDCPPWSPAATLNCLSLGRVVNSHSPPRTTSRYGEISCPRILCLVSRQNRQLNRLLWQPTPIVLHQLERTFSSYVRIQIVVLKTYLGRWTIGRSGERESGISVLPARYDDDDYCYHYFAFLRITHSSVSRSFLTEVWVTAISGLFSVFWPILIKL